MPYGRIGYHCPVPSSASIHRDLKGLGDQPYDVLVVGGGAAGAATAREAALRGYRTGLIEREDFSAGASAHCFKVVHGGIRYIQHGDVRRLRASCRERAVLLRIAPHLVAPLQFAIPTYGQGKSSKWFLGTGMLLYDALTADLNRHVLDPARRIRPTRFLGRDETLALFPSIEQRNLSGAAVFEDGQMYNPPRLVLGFVKAAAELGATVANYVEATSLLFEGSRVIGVTAADRLGNQRFEIRARLVINAAGPWAEGLLQSIAPYGEHGSYSRDTCFMVARRYETPMALAVQGRARDSDALVARNTRHLFLVPWRDCTLVGVWHVVVPREPDAVALPRVELRQFIDEFNASYPALRLQESEVRRVDFGLVPFGEAARQGGGLSFGKQSRLIDHRRHGDVDGLISLISVRYTVARRDAVDALNLAATYLGVRASGRESGSRPLPGGDIANFARSLRECAARRPAWLPATATEALVRNYGTHAEQVLALAARDPQLARYFSGSEVSYAEAAYAVREEMAQRMTDVVLRRTGLGTNGHPGCRALDEMQELLRRELSWSEERMAEERAALERHFVRYLAPAPAALEGLARSA